MLLGTLRLLPPVYQLPRPAKITDAKRRLKGEAVEEQADKRHKKEEKAEKAAKKDQTVKDDVSAIVNKRYDQMIHGPSGDLFLSGFYLNPVILLQSERLSSASGKVDQDLRDSMPSYAKVLAKELQAVGSILHSVYDLSIGSSQCNTGALYRNSRNPFVAIKIFSILGNSMPEERTVSRFTRINSKDRANQDASMIVNQTKIYQHLWHEACAAGKLVLIPLPAPIVVSDTEKAEAPRVSLTPECEAGLAALNAVDSDEDISSSSLYSTELEQRQDGVDITLPFFRDLLSDKPIDGADAIRSIGEGSKSGGKAKNKASSTVWDGEAEKIAF
ncbi:hypothetical protein B0H14DRAFT_3140133 [Mycena olivaceomarginata]|nr:hypothetical protein B0H14DRAFT_3140133 [Mycena olivaceomarginata]